MTANDIRDGATPTSAFVDHDRAWTHTIPADAAARRLRASVTVVEVGPRDKPYWWVLCPTDATLVPRPDAYMGVLGDCTNPDCCFDRLHDVAARLIGRRAQELRS